MNGREEQLVHRKAFIDSASGRGLPAANDTKAGCFRFFERVDGTTEELLQKAAMKNDLDAHVRRTFAPVNDLRAQRIMQTQIHLVQNRVYLAVACVIRRYFDNFFYHFLKSRHNILCIL